ncbi:hypothetical protein Taro_045064 [Colocasia esculenta]|uniref:Uncharacterized protein n=1 Tax=Colocasia esculenta TaxID=4460 RepID=A0A843X214_COLES|nr:hypothetical protein [Colocasia esculenta]
MSEVQGGSACGPSTLWRSKVAMFGVSRSFSRGCSVSLVVTPGCSFPTSWRSGMSRVWPDLVVGRGVTLFRCFVVLYSRSRGNREKSHAM